MDFSLNSFMLLIISRLDALVINKESLNLGYGFAFSPTCTDLFYAGFTDASEPNKVYGYSVDNRRGSLTSISGSPYSTGSGNALTFGMSFSPFFGGKSWAGVARQTSSSSYIYVYRVQENKFSSVQKVALKTPQNFIYSPLVQDMSGVPQLLAAAASIQPNQIIPYRVDEDRGTLTPQTPTSADGSPQIMAFSPFVRTVDPELGSVPNLYGAAEASGGKLNIYRIGLDTTFIPFSVVDASVTVEPESTSPSLRSKTGVFKEVNILRWKVPVGGVPIASFIVVNAKNSKRLGVVQNKGRGSYKLKIRNRNPYRAYLYAIYAQGDDGELSRPVFVKTKRVK